MASNRRVLIISPVPTHPVTGGNRARIHMLLEALDILGVDFHFVFITWESADKEAMEKRWGKQRVTVIPHQLTPRYAPLWRRIRNFTLRHLQLEQSHPLEVDFFRSPDLERAVMDVAHDYQPKCVMVEYVFNSWMLDLFPSTVRKLVDTHDRFADRNEHFRKAGIQEKWFSTTRRQERKGLRRADCILAVQEQEADYFRQLTGREVITAGQIFPIVSTPDPKTSTPTVLFVGGSNTGNRDTVSYCINTIWPMIRSQLPAARLLIVGRICESISGGEKGVELYGQVPELATVYAKAHVVFNPVRAGTGNKIKSIEALAYGRPLVTTTVGSLGIEGGNGRAFLVGNDAKSLAEHCLLLLRDRQRRSALASEAIRFMSACNQENYQALKRAFGTEV
jgi:glycosyltransferase involved in cell wall biosynthesis